MTMPDSCFRKLGPTEEKEFRQWAHENFKPNTEPKGIWHPVVRDEWAKLQKKWEEDHASGQGDN